MSVEHETAWVNSLTGFTGRGLSINTSLREIDETYFNMLMFVDVALQVVRFIQVALCGPGPGALELYRVVDTWECFNGST